MESILNLRPWEQWDHVTGEPREGTMEAISLLEKVLEIHPKHAFALHLHIHAWEASLTPGNATRSADTLNDLVPGIGHLQHMPSHIYVRTGRWDDAIESNIKAVEADLTYIKSGGINRGFIGMYYSHNRHLLSLAAAMVGRRELALSQMKELVNSMTPDFIADFHPLADGFTGARYEYIIRFGDWDAMLAEPEPLPMYPFARVCWRAMRAVSYAALGDTAKSRAEFSYVLELSQSFDLSVAVSNNTASNLVSVMKDFVEGEILIGEGKFDEAITKLTEAANKNDSLKFDEPTMFVVTPRHPLGALLARLGRHEEAIKVFKEDLFYWPRNGWSLQGLERSLRELGRIEEADQVLNDFNEIWKSSDMRPRGTSCCCVPND